MTIADVILSAFAPLREPHLPLSTSPPSTLSPLARPSETPPAHDPRPPGSRSSTPRSADPPPPPRRRATFPTISGCASENSPHSVASRTQTPILLPHARPRFP